MPRHVVDMLLQNRGESKNRRSHDLIVAALGEDATVSEPDEVGVFEIELEADDIDHARRRALNSIAASKTSDHVLLLHNDELPAEWHARAAPARARPQAG